MGLAGMRMPEIAACYGVSRQRIKQILTKHFPDWHKEHGGVVVKKIQQQKWFDKWGHKRDDDLYTVQRHKFIRKKANASRTGYKWTVVFGDLDWPTHCPILGIEIDYYAEARQENSPSFDRLDSNKGYETGNVRVLSWRANRIKNDGTAEEHEKIAQYIKTTTS